MTYNYRGRTITIDDNLIRDYENVAVPFTERRAQYFAYTSGCNDDMTIAEMEQRIKAAILSETSLYQRKDDIFAQAVESGLVPISGAENAND